MPWIEGNPTQSGLYWYKTGDHDTTVVELSDDGSIVIRENRQSVRLDLEEFQARFGPGRWFGPISMKMQL